MPTTWPLRVYVRLPGQGRGNELGTPLILSMPFPFSVSKIKERVITSTWGKIIVVSYLSLSYIMVLWYQLTSTDGRNHYQRKDPGQARTQTSILLVPSCRPDVPCLLRSEWQTIGDPWSRVYPRELCTSLDNICLPLHDNDGDNSEGRHTRRIPLLPSTVLLGKIKRATLIFQ